MAELGVETRPVFFCAHHMPMYEQADTFPVAQDVAARGISLPSFPALTEEELNRVASSLEAGLLTASK